MNEENEGRVAVRVERHRGGDASEEKQRVEIE
jgi:hypothetical protein